MHSTVIKASNTVLSTSKLLRLDLNCSDHTKKFTIYVVVEVLAKAMMENRLHVLNL